MSSTADSDLYAELQRRQLSLERTIAGYRAKVADCEQELEECSEALQQWRRDHDIVYPILTLPNEITSEIFVHCLTPFYDWERDIFYSTPDPRHAPMLLLHVCRAWRFIAMSTPRLWVYVRLHWETLSEAFFDAENAQNFLADCLSYGRACPLDLNIRGSSQREEDGRRFISTILDLLASRIELLELATDIKYYPERNPAFPLLQKLILGFTENDDDDDDLTGLRGNPIQIFREAPQLRELYLYSKVVPSFLAIPWERLTVFTGEDLSSKECVDVLRSAPSLSKAAFHETRMVPDTPTISHPNLKSLDVERSGNILFQFLTLPSLQELDMWDGKTEDVHLLQFLSGSSSSLLKLASGEVPFQSLSRLFALTTLKLCYPEDEFLGRLFRMLDRNGEHPGFLPQLQVLEIEVSSPIMNGWLIDALSSRRTATEDGGAKLHYFRQFWYDDSLQINYEGRLGLALMELVKNGMDVYIGPKIYFDDISSSTP